MQSFYQQRPSGAFGAQPQLGTMTHQNLQNIRAYAPPQAGKQPMKQQQQLQQQQQQARNRQFGSVAQQQFTPPVPTLGTDCQQITNNIWLGSYKALSLESLQSLNIRYVVNTARELKYRKDLVEWDELKSAGIVVMHLGWDDSVQQQIFPSRELNDAVQWVDKIAASNNCVLINCAMGRSRSTSLVIAYMIIRQGKTYDQALTEVQMRRPIAQPNSGFEDQLRNIEESVRIKQSHGGHHLHGNHHGGKAAVPPQRQLGAPQPQFPQPQFPQPQQVQQAPTVFTPRNPITAGLQKQPTPLQLSQRQRGFGYLTEEAKAPPSLRNTQGGPPANRYMFPAGYKQAMVGGAPTMQRSQSTPLLALGQNPW